MSQSCSNIWWWPVAATVPSIRPHASWQRASVSRAPNGSHAAQEMGFVHLGQTSPYAGLGCELLHGLAAYKVLQAMRAALATARSRNRTDNFTSNPLRPD